MIPLFDRYPRLAESLPRVALCDLPTPVMRLERLGAALLSWLLRISVPKPGNKRSCRKSDHHLSDA